MHKYAAKVSEILDDCSIKAVIDLGFEQQSEQLFKLAGIDLLDLSKDQSKLATVKEYLTTNVLQKPVILKSLKAKKSKKYLAFIYLSYPAKSINDQLAESGMVKPFVKKEPKQ
jgi:hypothetical protein